MHSAPLSLPLSRVAPRGSLSGFPTLSSKPPHDAPSGALPRKPRRPYVRHRLTWSAKDAILIFRTSPFRKFLHPFYHAFGRPSTP